MLLIGWVGPGLEVLRGVESSTVEPAVLCFLLCATRRLPKPRGPEGPVEPNAVLLVDDLGFEVLLDFRFWLLGAFWVALARLGFGFEEVELLLFCWFYLARSSFSGTLFRLANVLHRAVARPVFVANFDVELASLCRRFYLLDAF